MPCSGTHKGSEKRKNGSFAFIIPVYNHGSTVASVVEKALNLNLPVIVVDDGSTDAGTDCLHEWDGVDVLHHRKNRGKGAAILTGFDRAVEIADWAITIDADGQHHPADALTLIEAIPENARPLVVGARQGMLDRNVPWTSRFGRKFSNFWIRASGGPAISDTQSGFRIYPLPESRALKTKAGGYQFELEILVKAHWSKIPVIEAPVRVTYAGGALRISHFQPFVDFMRNARTFSRLIAQRLLLRPFTHRC
ncbi:MAG: glycosyltransferase family 2 protein [Deltaproteobacteria bacterium]|nr:glycosyltransferase family 2 protein [Deltaproteobacteria bacterium]MBW2175936.1 glycosyltransferase family 2 protein [Deltaproteobacteria bacterium]MBW2633296.1 glycosyltransferase family 2 protein [Deltaproteobacteria bacterium]MBW2677641.1 glycosyltransferase family 2 protein [Deltaproteobacteria bacterium]